MKEVEVREMYNSGMSQREIATALGPSQRVVWAFMKEYHIKARTKGKRDQWGEKNTNWKGSNASSRSLHRRVERQRGKPKRCEECRTTDLLKTYEWANMTGQFDVISDYRRLCRSCHRKQDNAICNFNV